MIGRRQDRCTNNGIWNNRGLLLVERLTVWRTRRAIVRTTEWRIVDTMACCWFATERWLGCSFWYRYMYTGEYGLVLFHDVVLRSRVLARGSHRIFDETDQRYLVLKSTWESVQNDAQNVMDVQIFSSPDTGGTRPNERVGFECLDHKCIIAPLL